jgi:hypothetical protein
MDDVNRKYKDSVFTLLFNDKERLLELYNAINGTNFTDKDGIEINTLQNALFMGLVNDISFILDNGSTLRVELRSLLRNRSAVVSANSTLFVKPLARTTRNPLSFTLSGLQGRLLSYWRTFGAGWPAPICRSACCCT